MSNPTDTNQASEDELEAKINTIIFARFYDIPDKQRSTIVKNLQALIRTEKLKLLAEVREAHRDGYMRGVSDFSGYFMDASNAGQRKPIMPEIAIELREEYRAPILLTKLEAEL